MHGIIWDRMLPDRNLSYLWKADFSIVNPFSWIHEPKAFQLLGKTEGHY